MLPAQQGLKPVHGLAAYAALRLIHQPQFVSGNRQAQIVLEHPPLADGGAHARLIEPIGVAAIGLGTIERGIGMAEQCFAVHCVVRADRNADAGRDAVGLRCVAVWRAQRFQNGLGKLACLGRLPDARHQDGEFVAAQPRHHLVLGEHRGDARGDGLKHGIAGRMAEEIVDLP